MYVLGKKYNYIRDVGKYSSIIVDESYRINEKNRRGIEPLVDMIEMEQEVPDMHNFTYKWSDGWYTTSCWELCESTKFQELKTYHDKIIEYINRTKNIRAKLCMPTFNTIGLTSEPGMGKSTLIRMLATTLQKPIYLVEDKDGYRFEDMEDGIIVVEDYDRFSEENKESLQVSINDIPSHVSLLIYTSNTDINDMNLDLSIKFEEHQHSTYKRSVDIMFEGRDDILEVLVKNKVSMRVANALLCAAYCYNGEPLEYIKDNVNTMTLYSPQSDYGVDICEWGTDLSFY